MARFAAPTSPFLTPTKIPLFQVHSAFSVPPEAPLIGDFLSNASKQLLEHCFRISLSCLPLTTSDFASVAPTTRTPGTLLPPATNDFANVADPPGPLHTAPPPTSDARR